MDIQNRTSTGWVIDQLEAIKETCAITSHYKRKKRYSVMKLTELAGSDEPQAIEERAKYQKAAQFQNDMITAYTALRRAQMALIFDFITTAQDKEWCPVKHATSISGFQGEVYDALADDPAKRERADNLSAVADELQAKAISHALEMELTDCMECLDDKLKGGA